MPLTHLAQLMIKREQLKRAEAAIERVRELIEMAPTRYDGSPRVVRVDDLERALDPEQDGPVAGGAQPV